MNLIIEQAALQRALQHVTGAIASRNTIPVLENVVIDALNGEIWLTATDLLIEAKSKVDGTIVREGQVTASASLLGDLVRSAPSGSQIGLDFAGDDPRLKLSFGRSRYNVPVLPRADFPVLKPLAEVSMVKVQAVDLLSVLSRTAYAQGSGKTSAHLQGVYLHRPPEQDTLRGVSTDGHRLALADAPVIAPVPEFPGVILPAKAVAEFTRALNGRAGEIRLTVSPSGVILDLGDAVVRTKVVDAVFVDYARVLPDAWVGEVDVDRQLFLETVRRVALVADNKDRSIRVTLERGNLSLQARNFDAGSGHEEIEVDYDGEPLTYGYNARYLVDALGQTEAETVALRFPAGQAPTRVEPSAADPEHGPVLSLVSPQAV